MNTPANFPRLALRPSAPAEVHAHLAAARGHLTAAWPLRHLIRPGRIGGFERDCAVLNVTGPALPNVLPPAAPRDLAEVHRCMGEAKVALRRARELRGLSSRALIGICRRMSVYAVTLEEAFFDLAPRGDSAPLAHLGKPNQWHDWLNAADTVAAIFHGRTPTDAEILSLPEIFGVRCFVR